MEGFIFFADAFKKIVDFNDKRITYDFTFTTWFEANLVSVLSSLFEMHRLNKCHVELRGVSNSLRKVFKRNGFYSYYDLGEEKDIYGTTIPFKKFNCRDEEGFTHYLDEEVIPKIRLPLSEIQIRRFKNCLQEIFVNVELHSNSDSVFTCGQYYYDKRKVAFTITDIGKTIGHNVRKKVGPDVIDCDAIEWATQFGNTTKVAKDGGIGLDLIKKYMSDNGIFQIVSGDGFWEQNHGEVYYRKMNTYFGGTIINIVSDLKKQIDIPKRKILF